MFFGLFNALVTFQAWINKVLCLFFDIFCITYINNILVVLSNLKDHYKHVCLVLKAF
jgi:hypothetical protein